MGKMDPQIHFKCVRCGNERDKKREMSHVSKSISRTPRFRGLKSHEQGDYLFCRYCVAGTTDLPKSLANFLSNREYWEKRVTEEEMKSPKPNGKVKKDQLITLAQIEQQHGIPRATVASWINSGKLQKFEVATMPAVKESEFIKVAETHTARPAGYIYSHTPVDPAHRKVVAEKVRQARALRQITQAEVAKEAGFSRGTVSHIELGKDFVTKEALDIAETWADLVLMPEKEKEKEIPVRSPRKPDPVPEPMQAPTDNLPPWANREVEELKAEVASLKQAVDELASFRVQVGQWVRKYKQEAPGWDGWKELGL